MDEIIREIRDAPKAKGVDRIYLPGEMKWGSAARKALAEGMVMPTYVLESLRGLAADVELDPAQFKLNLS